MLSHLRRPVHRNLRVRRARPPGAIDHLALDVDDIESAWEEVRMAGLAPLEDAIQFLPFWENGVRFFNLLGPNGETVEFSQRL